MSTVIKTRIHWDSSCSSVAPSPVAKLQFTNRYISKSEYEMHVLGNLPMLRHQIKCPSCTKWIKIEYHDKNNKHSYVFKKFKWDYYKGHNVSVYRCSCGRTKEDVV